MKRLTSVLALLVLALAVRDGYRKPSTAPPRADTTPCRPAVASSAARSRRGHPASSWGAVAIAAVAVLVLTPVSGTFAGFSDADSTEQRLAAGTLELDGGDDLRVSVGRGGSDSDSLTITNDGTTPAALRLHLDPTGGTTCAGYVPAAHSGDVLLFLDGDGGPTTVPVGDLCAGPFDLAWPGGAPLEPGASTTVHLRVTVAADALFRWSSTSQDFDLEVVGEQPGGGFSHAVEGTFTVDIEDYFPSGNIPAPPGECPGIGEYRIIRTSNNANDLDLSDETGPAYIRATSNGKFTVTGTPQGDCIVVGNGNATVYGGDGNDVIVSDGNSSGAGKVELFGEGGDDTLIARRGSALLDGGEGINTCTYTGSPTLRNCNNAPTVETTSLSEPAPLVSQQRASQEEVPDEAAPADPPSTVTVPRTTADVAPADTDGGVEPGGTTTGGGADDGAAEAGTDEVPAGSSEEGEGAA